MAHLDPFFISFSWMINIYDFLIKHCHCPIRKRLNYQAPEPLMVNSQLLTTPSIHVNSLQRGTPQVFRCFCEICPSRCLASWMCSPQGHHEPRISRGKWRCHRQKNMKEHHPQIEVFTGEIWEHHPQIEVFLGKDEKNMEQHHIHRVIEVLILRSNSLPRNFLRMYHRTK